MRSLILSSIMLIGMISTVHAQFLDLSTIAFNYTGQTAERVDGSGWEPRGYGVLGGPMANERLGLAQQFVIYERTHMTFLNLNATVLPNPGTTTFNYNLYGESAYSNRGAYWGGLPIPSGGSLLTSIPLTFSMTEEEAYADITKYVNEQVPFEYYFDPGTYWLSEEGTGRAYVGVEQTYIDPPLGDGIDSDHVGAVAAPEPYTFILLFIGLIGMVVFKKGGSICLPRNFNNSSM